MGRGYFKRLVDFEVPAPGAAGLEPRKQQTLESAYQRGVFAYRRRGQFSYLRSGKASFRMS